MTNNNYVLREATVTFSKDIVAFCSKEPATAVSRPLIEQLIRSATSVGANYAEADNASSRNDFRNKLFIAKKEAAETKFWLSLLVDIASDYETCTKLISDCQILLMTLQKVVNSLRVRALAPDNR